MRALRVLSDGYSNPPTLMDSPKSYRGSISSAGIRNRRRPNLFVILSFCAWGGLLVLLWMLYGRGIFFNERVSLESYKAGYIQDPVLISYSYFEKDEIQRDNFIYFLAAGTQYPAAHKNMHWVFVISGDACGPCKTLYGFMSQEVGDYTRIGIKSVYRSPKFTLLHRIENVGMDLAAHNVTLEYLAARNQISLYKKFIFLNSSVKGPFFPSYMPPQWHWTHAYLTRFTGNIHAVSSSLVCLPEVDAGGPGPRLESWAFALDTVGLAVTVKAGTFYVRSCKLCMDSEGIVVGGEYGITLSMFKHGYNIATLMSKYAQGINWQDERHWHCNNNVHPSRHGTYDGISQHPYETVFVKSSWHVADPYTRRYASWHVQHLAQDPGTSGHFDQPMYKYGVSLKAQDNPGLENAYRVKLTETSTHTE